MIPIHATLTLGDSLPPDHFSPGGSDKPALHVTAYWGGKTVETATRYHFERTGLGAPWVLAAVTAAHTLHGTAHDLGEAFGELISSFRA